LSAFTTMNEMAMSELGVNVGLCFARGVGDSRRHPAEHLPSGVHDVPRRIGGIPGHIFVVSRADLPSNQRFIFNRSSPRPSTQIVPGTNYASSSWKAVRCFATTRTGPNRFSYLFRFFGQGAMIRFTWPGLTTISNQVRPGRGAQPASPYELLGLWLTSIVLL